MFQKPSKNEDGMSYIEVMIAIMILTVGILAQLSALTFSMIRVHDNEKRNAARQIGSSAIETIFAARDLGSANGFHNWDAVNLSTNSPDGIFVSGWHPIRKDSGKDGIIGTADDACAYDVTCSLNGYTNTSTIDTNYERRILITDIIEAGSTKVRKRLIEVKVRYWVGQLRREESTTTLIADLPFYN